MIPLKRKTPNSRIREDRAIMARERHKPEKPGPYIYVSGGTGDVCPLETTQSVPWKNNFMWYGTSYVGFRHGMDGHTELIGQIDLTLGAVTGTVAFTLPRPFRAISFDYTFPVFGGGTDWFAGVMSVNPTGNGDVYVYWPVQATV